MAYTNPGFNNGTEPYINATNLNALANAVQLLPIENGGTGATTAANARANLGLNTTGVNALVNGNALPIANGGTGATTATNARSNLGLGTAALLAGDHLLKTYTALEYMFENNMTNGAIVTLADIPASTLIYFSSEDLIYRDKPAPEAETATYFYLLTLGSPSAPVNRKFQIYVPETGSEIYWRKRHGGTSTSWYRFTSSPI